MLKYVVAFVFIVAAIVLFLLCFGNYKKYKQIDDEASARKHLKDKFKIEMIFGFVLLVVAEAIILYTNSRM